MSARLPIALCAASTLALAACQSPVLCGARGEPCCDDGCHPALACAGDRCVSGVMCVGIRGCDYVRDTGCAPGQTCRVSGDDVGLLGTCVPLVGNAPEGYPCTMHAECGPAMFCSAFTRTCRSTCCADVDCPGARHCSGSPGLCTGDDDCDYWSPASCGGTDARCYPQRLRDGRFAPECLLPGTVPTFGPCEGHSDCVPGHVCITRPGSSAACFPICDATHGCPGGGGCAEIEGNPGYGFCGG